ncbi:MAG TPA: hypothetical protein EYP59_21625 [Thiotrichaceae bacterium]|nr:hypothetical protein [Thiotrichaceae bacterium]
MINHIPNEPAQLKFISPEGKEMDIPPEGALGLLALGAVGIKAWRQARKEAGEPSHWYRKSPENDDKTPEAETND